MGNLLKPVTGKLVSTTINRTSKLFLIFLIVLLSGIVQHVQGQSASFTPSSTSSCTPTTIYFTDTSSGATSWFWDFGNSNYSTLQNPSANYPQPGVYSVTLTINGGGSPSLSSVQQIYIYPKPNPVGPALVQGCEPFSTTLTATATPVVVAPFTINGTFPAPPISYVGGITGGNAVQYTWNFFGDLPTVVQSSPILNLTNIPAGIYDVLITALDDKGCSNSVFVQSVITVNPKPSADFSFVKANACGTGNVTFTGTASVASGTIAGYAWNFNDPSSTSPLQNPVHNFTSAGTYNVSFTATSSVGCLSDPVVKPVVFNSSNSVGFSFAGSCAGQPVAFTDLSAISANIVSWAWVFGDGNTATSQSPSHTYSSAGSYTAQLTVTFNDGCMMSTTHTVTITGPTSSFSFVPTSACIPNYTVAFTSTATAVSPLTITGWAWNFGDPSSGASNISGLANPSHIFAAAGTYSVSLTVTSSDGCTSTFSTNVVVPPVATINLSATPTSGCAPLTSAFTPIYSNPSDPIASYSWNFGDLASGGSNTSTASNPSHTYNNAGVYDVTLTVTTTNGCVLTVTNTAYIKVGTPPIITSVTAASTFCLNNSIVFTANYSTLTDKLVWNYGDGSGLATQVLTPTQSAAGTVNQSYSYNAPGNYPVTVTAYYNNCPSVVYTLSGGVTVHDPTVGFTPSATKACSVPATISFTNISTGATSYNWDFGDPSSGANNTSILTSPSHTFNTTGDYLVTLIAHNSTSGCSETATSTIHITTSNPLFTVNSEIVCAGTASSFTNQIAANSSSNFIVGSYLWTFGDGNTSTAANPSHTYTTPGLYTVTLQVTEAQGCVYSYTLPAQMDVRGPIVNFTNSPSQICAGTVVTFTNATTKAANDPANPALNNYYWTFGDGGTSTLENPTHTYVTNGSFTATLQVTNNLGCVGSKSINNSVVVPAITAGFTTSKSIYCIDDAVNFTNTSTGTITTYAWDFGDPTHSSPGNLNTSAVTNPSHTYTVTGTYNITLTVTSSLGCTSTMINTISVVDGTGAINLPSPETTELGCAPASATFNAVDPPSVVSSYAWTFGDGQTSNAQNPNHYYTRPGHYTVTLTEILTGGCTRTSNISMHVAGAVGDFSYTNTPQCAPHLETFTATNLDGVTSLTWDFGNGTTVIDNSPSSPTTTTTYTYTTWGTRLPILILRNPTCGDYAYYYGVDQRINTSEAPIAAFTSAAISGQTCQNQSFQFTDISTIVDPRYAVSTWNWSFGDPSSGVNNSSTAQNPTHTYTSPGTYTITLIITNGFIPGGCPASISHNIIVNPLPVVATLTPQELCSGGSSTAMVLNESNSLTGTTFAWSRTTPAGITTSQPTSGTGIAIGGTIPGYSFTNSTSAPVVITYTITPTGPAPTYCVGNAYTTTVQVDPIPTVNSASTTTICNNSAVGYNITSATSGTTFTWVASEYTAPSGGHITGFSNCSSGCGTTITQTLANSGTSPGVVRYIITPTGPNPTDCPGIPFNLDVTVNPTSTVLASPQTICSGQTTSIGLSTGTTGASVSYSWTASVTLGNATGFSSGSGSTIAQTLSNVAPPPSTVDYHITPAIGTCAGTPIDDIVTVNPGGKVDQPVSQIVCNTASTAAVNFTTTTLTGITTFTWTNNTTSIGLGASGSGDISSFTASNNGTSPVIATIIVTPHFTYAGQTCDGSTKTFTITVNPTGQLNQPSNAVFCKGSTGTVTFGTANTGGSTTYAWTNDNTAIGLSANGGGNISFTATNSTNAPILANIVVTPTFTNGSTSCPGPAKNFTITINPSGQVNIPGNQTLCNNSSTTLVTFGTTNTGGTTTYTWTNNTPSIGLAANSGGNVTGIPVFTAINNTAAPIVATITVTPTYSNGSVSCQGTAQTFTITVNPTPVINSGNSKTICNNSAIGYTILSATTGATFTWTASTLTAPTGGTITGFSDCSSSCGTSINQTLVNTGSSTGVVRYIITPTGPATTNCPGTPFNFDVTVQPVAVVTATPSSQSVCNNSATNIALSSTTIGTVSYSWTASLTSGTATGFSSGTVPPIVQTLHNTTSTPATVTYHIIPSIGGCAGTPLDVVVTVNPAGEVDQPASQVVCNNTGTAPINFTTTDQTGTTTYTWTNTNTSIGLAANSGGNVTGIPTFTATNSGTSQISGTIIVTPTFTYNGVSCTGPTKSFTIAVNPTGEVNQPGNYIFCNAALSTVTFGTSNTDGTTTYSWTNSNTTIGLGGSGTGNLSFTATNTTTAPISSTIVVTPTYTNGGTSCAGPTKTFTITINPTGQMNNPGDQDICNNSSTTQVTFSTNNTVGTTTYTWINDTPGISLASSGSGPTIPAFIALNTGTAPVVATITATPTFTNGSISCQGPTQSFTITVEPTPTVTSASVLSVCSGKVMGTYQPTSAVAGTTFTWTAVNSIGTVTGYTSIGSGSISDLLTNTGVGNGQVNYIITPTGPTGCSGPPFDLQVNVINCSTQIGVAKQLVSMTNNGDGTFTALFNIRVQNYGTVELDNIQVAENLTTAFGALNYAVLGLSSTSFAVNTSFTGVGNLLDNSATSNILEIGASTDIRLTVKILSAGSYLNTVTATSTTNGATDISQNGSDPDPDGDGDPSAHSDPTPVITACSPAMSVTLGNAVICYPTATTYSPVPTVTGTPASYLWTTDGTGTFDHNNIANPIYTPSTSDVQDGQVVLTLTATSGGACPNSIASMVLTIWTPPTVGVTDATICAGNSFAVTGATATNFSSLLWSTSGTGTFNNTNTLNPTYTPSTADITAGHVNLTLTAYRKPTPSNTCTDGSATMVLTITPAPTVNAGVDATICTTTTTYTLSTAAAINYASLLWTTNGTGTFTNATIQNAVYTPSAADIATGQVQLTLTATGNGSCSPVSDFMVLNIWPAPTAYAGPNAAICSGNPFVLSGATATNYASLTWSSTGGTFNNANALNPTFTPTTTGAITITLTANALGNCSNAVSSMTLTVNAAPTLTPSAITNTQCNASVGAVTLTGTGTGTVSLDGGTPVSSPHSYTGLAAGYHTAVYTVTATGCTATTGFNITNTNSTLTGAVTSLTNVNCYGNSTGAATVTASGGTSPFTYKLNGVLQGSNSFTALTAGDYVALITDANTCTFTVAFTITQPTQLSLVLASQTNVLCKGSATGSAIVSAAGGAPGYTYTVTAGPNTPTVTGNVISGMIAGTYTVHVVDANTCSQNLTVTITEPTNALNITGTPAVLTDPACSGAATGSINITVSGGTAPYHYAWSNGFNGEDLTNVPAGSYSVIVTDANGCSVTGGIYTLNNPAAKTITVGAIVNTTCGASTGSVVLTSSDGSDITLGATTQHSGTTFTGLVAGYYTATSNGTCPATTNFSISNTTSTLTAVITSVTAPLCHNQTGSVVVTGSGGVGSLTYLLDGVTSQSSGSFSGVAVGDHTIKVSDSNGCTYVVSFTITNPSALNLTLSSQTNVLCKSSATGSAIVIASGGTPGYTYSVTAGPNTPTVTGNVITGMIAGAYTVHVVDANTCSQNLTVTISEPTNALDITTVPAVLTDPTCYGSANGIVNITVSGGTTPYSYAWTNGTNAQDASSLVAGTYSVTVTDAKGCQINGGPYVLSNPAALVLNASGIVNTQCNASVGSVTFTEASNTAGTFTLGVTPQTGTTATFTGLKAGFYTATFTATATGCTATTTFNIINTNSTLAATVNVADIKCNGGTTTATITATGGTGTYTYLLNGITSNTNGSFAGLSAGTNNVLVTDGNDCTYYLAFDIDQPAPLVLSPASQTNVTCKGLSNGTVTVQATGGTTPYVYSITAGTASISGNIVTGMKAGNYTIKVVDANSCSTTLDVTITETTCNPVTVNDNPTTLEDTPATGNVLSNDSDPNNPALPLTVTTFMVNGTAYPAGTTATIPGVGTLVINSDGTYTFTPEPNYNGPVPPATYTASNGTNTNTAELTITVTPVNDAPVAGTSSMTSQFNPGGTNSLPIPALQFSGTDVDGTIASILIPFMPTNATSITVGGTTYTALTFPPGGISVPTNTTGQPLLPLSVDPIDGAVTSVLSYNVIDNNGLASVTTGSVSIPFVVLSVSGTVFNDPLGLSNNTVDGTGTNEAGALYMNLVSSLNQVVASVAVASDGTYQFTDADGLAVNTSYNLILTNGPQTVGATLSTATYPAGVTSTGENIGTGPGSDGTINGILAVNTNSGDVANADFGVTSAMVISAGANQATCSSANTFTLSGASAANYTSVLWTTNGTGSFVNPAIVNAVYTPSAADIATGEVQLTLTGTGVGSVPTMSSQMTLTIWPAATAYAGPDAAICSGNTFILTGATAANYSTMTWSSAGGTFDDVHALNPTFTPNTTGPVTITLTAAGLGTCSNAVSSLTLTVNPTPTLTASAIVNTNCNVSVGAVTLTGNIAGTISLDGGAAQASPHTYNGLPAGYHTAIITATAGGCAATTSFNIINTNSTLTGTVTLLTNVLCNGGSTGAATITAAGGTLPYSYQLNGGTAQPTGVFTGLSAGTYTVLITDANSCTYTVSFTITQPIALLAQIVSSTNVTCFNAANGTATVNATGGTTPYTYSWNTSPVKNTASVTGLTHGTYTVTVTDAKGCTTTANVTITRPAAALDITTVPAVLTNPTCYGSANGSVNITVSGGTTPYSYAWTNGTNAQDASSLVAGTYSVTVTDANGCQITGGPYVLSNPAAVTLAASGIVNTQCNASVGAVTLTGSAAGTISLDGGSAQNSPYTYTGLAAGYHTAVFTAVVNGCTATTTFNIINTNSTLAATVNVADIKCNGGTTTATITATGGTGSYTYLLNGTTSNTNGSFAGLSAGTNNVLVTDGNGCTYYLAFDIDQPAPLLAQIVNSTNVTCFNAGNGTATVNATGGTTPYSYSWNTSPVKTTASVTGLTHGTYTVTVTDANGCTTTANVTIMRPAAALAIAEVSQTNPTCHGGSDGNIDISVTGGTTPYSYSWSNGFNGQDPTGLAAGSYTIIITDANGCTATQTYTLNDPAALVLNASGIVNTQCNSSVGSVTLTEASNTAGTFTIGGTPQTGTTATFTGLKAGFYTATFTATATGCTATTTFNIININSTLAATVSFVNPNCFGETVTATVTATGGTTPYSFQLNGGTAQSTGVFNTLAAGSYNVLVTDNNGCTYTVAFTITQPTQLEAQIVSSTNVTCFGAADGTATTDVTGGTTPYAYLWDDPSAQTTATATGLAPGTYHFTVTDALGCKVTNIPVTITGPAALTATASKVTDVLCYGAASGSATVVAGGGTAPYTYAWNTTPVQTTATATGLAAGTSYAVTVTDVNGCTVTSSNVTISQSAGPIVPATPVVTNANCQGGLTGSVQLSASGGTGTLNYTISTGAASNTTGLFTGLSSGGYTYTVTDANGCSATGSFQVTDPNLLTLAITTEVDVTCNGLGNGSASVTVSGGTSPYTFSWTGPGIVTTLPGTTTGLTNSITGLAAGTFIVTVTDNKGCTAVQTITITQPNALNAVLSSQVNVLCNGGSTGKIIMGATGGTAPYTFTSPGLTFTGNTASGVAQGTYLITAHDANSCTSATLSVTITEPAALTAVASTVTNVLCFGAATGSATIVAGGGTAPYTYLWSNGSTDQIATNLIAGTYSVLVTDNNDCSFTVNSIIISGPVSALNASITSSTNPSCEGTTTGSATVTASGGTTPYYYLWSNGQTTATATGLVAGTYLVTVTDANGCLKQLSVLLADPTGVTATITSSTNVSCNGGTNGAATVTATGGSGTYTYSWNTSPVKTTASVTGLAAGQYTVTVTGTGGCAAQAVVTITQPDVLVADITSSSNVNCRGGSNGAATVNITGGTTPYTYLWPVSAGSQTTASATNLAAGTYVVTVTDKNGCQKTASVTITEPAIALSASITASTNVLCYGTATGSATVTANNGTAPYIYLWSNGATDQTATGLIAGTYSVTITDNNGCTVTLTNAVTITQPAGTITVNAGPDQTICATTAAISLTGTSAANALSYQWTTSGTGIFTNPTSLTSATYTPSAADIATGQVQLTLTAKGNGTCAIVSDFMVLNIWQPPTANAGPATAAICAGSTYVITGATATNYSSLTWTSNAGGSFNNLNALNPTFTPATGFVGTVRLTLTASKLGGSCSDATNYIDLTVNASPTLIVSSVANTTCNNSAGSVMLTGSVAGTVTLDGVSKSSPATFTGHAAGYFTATFTAAGSTACTGSASFQITNTNSNLSGTVTTKNASCSSTSGSVTVNATGGTTTGGSVTATDGYWYSLDGGVSQTSNSFTGLSAGNHTVKITDDNACTYSIDFYIDQPTLLILELSGKTNVMCYGSSTGSAIVNAAGGTTPYTYSVISGPNTPTVTGNVITGMIAGTYNLQVRDANNCTASLPVVITQPVSSLNITAVPAVLTNPSCNGTATGSINTTISGGTPPYSYVWSNGTNSADLTGLLAGTYTVTVIDANDCSISGGPYVLTNPAAVTLTAGSIVSTTCGSSTGSVVLTSSDASSVTLNGVIKPSGSVFTGLTAGTYTPTSNGTCQASTTFRINNSASTLTATITNVTLPSCHNGTGSVVVSASGGTGARIYSLDGAVPQSTGTFFGISVGNHTISVFDANNCEFPVSFDITNPPSLTLALTSQTNVACYGSATGSVIVNAAGGTTGYTYSIISGPNSPAVTGNVITGMVAGTFNVQVEDANHCSAPLQVVITQPSGNLTITATPVILVNPTCYGAADGSIKTTVSGGTPPYDYVWSNGTNAADPTGLAAGTYSVTVTDFKGCTITGGPYILTTPAAVTLTTSSIVNTTCDSPTGSVILTSSDASSVTLNGVTKPSGSVFSGLTAGSYTPTSNGACQASTTFNINNSASTLAASITNITFPVCTNGTGSVEVAGTGGIGNLSYSLDGTSKQSSGTFLNVSVGNHVVTVSDVNNCTYPVSFFVNNPPPVTLILTSQSSGPCSGLSTGIITITTPTGVGITYSIDGTNYTNTTGLFTSVPAGNYSVTAKTQAGCISPVTSVTIDANPPILALTSATVTSSILCNGGTATVTLISNGGTAPVSYTLNGTTNNTGVFAGVKAGNALTYSITDANQCGPIIGTIDVTQPEAITPDAVVTNVTCMGAANGSINLTVTGGIAPFTFAWTGPGTFTSTSQSLAGLSGGTYNVIVTDANNCTKTTSAIVQESNTALSASATLTPEIQTLSMDSTRVLTDAGGTITPAVVGGTSPYTYSWTGPNSYLSSSEYPTDLVGGTYNGTITDANGCITTVSAVITVQIVLAEDVNCPILVPNSFSPNGDGIHDYFKIACLYNYVNPVIEIYNRWGNLVYKKDHYGDTDFWGSEAEAWWGGRSENNLTIGNQIMPVGTYYYILKLTNAKVLTGFLFLNK